MRGSLFLARKYFLIGKIIAILMDGNPLYFSYTIYRGIYGKKLEYLTNEKMSIKPQKNIFVT